MSIADTGADATAAATAIASAIQSESALASLTVTDGGNGTHDCKQHGADISFELVSVTMPRLRLMSREN